MSSPAVAVFRGNKYYFHTQFQPPLPWTPIQLKGHYEIQSIFYEITTTAIQVRILTPEVKEALVLFPIHFGSKEYAYLFLSFKQYILQHLAVPKDKAFDDLIYLMDITLTSNPFEEEVRIKYLHSLGSTLETYDD